MKYKYIYLLIPFLLVCVSSEAQEQSNVTKIISNDIKKVTRFFSMYNDTLFLTKEDSKKDSVLAKEGFKRKDVPIVYTKPKQYLETWRRGNDMKPNTVIFVDLIILTDPKSK